MRHALRLGYLVFSIEDGDMGGLKSKNLPHGEGGRPGVNGSQGAGGYSDDDTDDRMTRHDAMDSARSEGHVVPDENDLPPQLARILDKSHGRHIVLIAASMMAVSVLRYLWGSSDASETAMYIVVSASLVVFYFAFVPRIVEKSSADISRYYRSLQAQPQIHDIVVSARSVSFAGIFAATCVAILGCSLLLFGYHLMTDSSTMAWAIVALVGSGFIGSAALVVSVARNEISLSKEGIQVRPRMPNMTISIPHRDISLMEMDGRVLLLAFTEPLFGKHRRSRHIILGDGDKRSEFSQAVQSLAHNKAPLA